jgi:hypothetical protein
MLTWVFEMLLQPVVVLLIAMLLVHRKMWKCQRHYLYAWLFWME